MVWSQVSHWVPLQKDMEWSSVDPDPDCRNISKFVKTHLDLRSKIVQKGHSLLTRWGRTRKKCSFHRKLELSFMAGQWLWLWILVFFCLGDLVSGGFSLVTKWSSFFPLEAGFKMTSLLVWSDGTLTNQLLAFLLGLYFVTLRLYSLASQLGNAQSIFHKGPLPP